MYIIYYTRMSRKIFFQGVSCETLILLEYVVNTYVDGVVSKALQKRSLPKKNSVVMKISDQA